MTLTYHGRHVKKQLRRHPWLTAVVLVVLAFIAGLLMWFSLPANAATVSWGPANSAGNRALNWAEYHTTGHPYEWGGTGPWGYDCSGLVMTAYEHAGIQLPRTTYEMLASWHLVRTYHPERGDLAFYGSGHVELVTIWGNETFGAHDSGSTIGWIREWEQPAFYHVR